MLITEFISILLLADTDFGVFILLRAFIVERTILCGFFVPIALDTTSEIPNASKIALDGPPEIIPVPYGADLKITVLEENLAFTSW